MVNVKIFEVERDFQDKEKALEAKISDLQKRILQLEQDIGEHEEQSTKLREDLGMMREQNELMQQSRQALESQYIEEQGKWASMSERVTSHLDE